MPRPRIIEWPKLRLKLIWLVSIEPEGGKYFIESVSLLLTTPHFFGILLYFFAVVSGIFLVYFSSNPGYFNGFINGSICDYFGCHMELL